MTEIWTGTDGSMTICQNIIFPFNKRSGLRLAGAAPRSNFIAMARVESDRKIERNSSCGSAGYKIKKSSAPDSNGQGRGTNKNKVAKTACA